MHSIIVLIVMTGLSVFFIWYSFAHPSSGRSNRFTDPTSPPPPPDYKYGTFEEWTQQHHKTLIVPKDVWEAARETKK